jgi:site-specific recombinase XerD
MTTIDQTTWQEQFQAHITTHFEGKTLKAIEQHIRVFVNWHEAEFGSPFNPADLTEYALHQWRKESLDRAKVAPATWEARLWALRHLSEWIGKPELTANVKGKKAMRRSEKHRSLSEQELNRFVNTLETNIQRAISDYEIHNAKRDWATASLCLQAGLRVEEVTLLDASDITINERSGSVRVRNGKGSKERIVPLNLSARRALLAWHEVHGNTTATALFEGAGENERISVRTIQRTVESIGKQIGVPEVTPHWLRYTFAKRLERNGTSLTDIADLLGHDSTDTTRRYLRSALADLQSAVEE